MSIYAKVEGGEVVSKGALPRNSETISGFNMLGDVELKTYGYYPYSETIPSYDANTEKLGALTYTINDEDVVGSYPVEALSPAELTTKKNNLVARVMPKLNDYMFKTDWVEIAGANLTTPEKDAYDTLRTNMGTAKADLDTYTAAELAGLEAKLNACNKCMYSRFGAFSSFMTDLDTELATLTA